MWRSRSFRWNLLQLFDSRRCRPDLNHTSFLGLAGASSVCPLRSVFFPRALSYSSKSSPFSELRHSVDGSFDTIFITKKKEAAAESQDSDDDLVVPMIPEPYNPNMRFDDTPAECTMLFSMDVCSNQTLTWKTRIQAIEVISRLAKCFPYPSKWSELVNQILQIMFQLLVEEDGGGYLRSHRIAARDVIETMAVKHPEQVFPTVLEFASSSSRNSIPKYREAAVSALGDIAEGCSLLMKDKLEPLLGIVLDAHLDAEQTVKVAASYALRKFAEHLQPEIVSERQAVLPCILNALGDDDHYLTGIWNGVTSRLSDEFFVQWRSYDSLEALCDNMTGEEILPFLDPIMTKLFSDLQCGSYDRKLRSISAMCAVAAAAGQDFVPYAERVLQSMKPLLVLTGTDGGHFLRTQDFVFAGVLAKTVGRAGVEPMLVPYIEAAISATANSWNRIPGRHQRRYTYGFFCNAAETLGDGFAKYLPRVVPLAISSCNLDETPNHGHPEFRSIERMEVLDEKAAATQALGLFAVHSKSAFAPYLEESMSVMINHFAHYHEDVRLQGVIGLKNILTAAASVFESRRDGAAKAKEVLGTVMNHYIKAMDEDGDRRVVAQVCGNVVGILEDFRYATLEPYVPQIIDSASRLLQEQSACQRADDAEHRETLMAAVSNLLSALAKAPTTS